MANQLSQWADLGLQRQPYLVESAAALEARLWGRRNLRQLRTSMLDGLQPKAQEIRAIANLLHINPLWLSQAMVNSDSFAKLFSLVEQQQVKEGSWQKVWQPIEIKLAIADLRLRINYLRREQQPGLAIATYPPKVYVSNSAPLINRQLN